MKLDRDTILALLELEEDEFLIENFRRKHDIDPASSVFKTTIHRLTQEGKLRRLGWGRYRKIKLTPEVRWWNGEERLAIPFKWPYGVDDGSSFDFDENIELFPGDSIVIAGEPNWAKTATALNLLVNNINLFEGARLLVNEYKPERFRSRMNRITWVDYWNENRPKFELIPVTKNHTDYIHPNYLNIIDWLHISGEFWQVADQIQDMQMQLRNGILIVVLQKTYGKRLGVGDAWGTFFPAVYMIIERPFKLTVIKVKSAPRGKIKPEGNMYAFDLLDAGTKFHKIRQVKNCPKCKGRGYLFDRECDLCMKRGFVDL